MLATEVGAKFGIRINSIGELPSPSPFRNCFSPCRFGSVHGVFVSHSTFSFIIVVRELTRNCFVRAAPGVFPSEMTGSGSDENNKTSLENQFDPKSLGVPADRAGSEEDMAGTILYLASRAGQYTDGVIIPVDGGTLSTNPSSY